MTLTNFSTDSTATPVPSTAGSSDSTAATPASGSVPPVVDRRSPQRRGGESGATSRERRQFGSSHAELSDEGRELAAAIDRYKLQHHRRYITCDEMLSVLRELGYRRANDGVT